ncbi:MAG: family 10 glycosylhydrolase [Bacteroidales bacterium]|nr:family 10 glycosylhydrolase [Bacteroidales bacterium]MCM1147262.1 family 10 glycosylhydrolase [Bacteroidales bacterium]MCM1206305.1 family 10 glycosylhydrolase [Bacillota bacterium]MCM1510482.1 family 10 glycosylhydrolase [Clostridium sp.]
MKKIITLFILSTLFSTCRLHAQVKREFRGAWIQCVNGQFIGMGTQKMQETLAFQLDELQKDGCNAIFFQVRPECDALYESNLEPWSRFLTGKQGVAPCPYWDPLAWMIEQCHKRDMELHAWINPYRAKTKVTNDLADNHIAKTNPGCVFQYDGLLILNPAQQKNRDYICRVVQDIITRYNVDGIHIDDYFYPYPAAGQQIPDAADFKNNSNGISNIQDWRRYNVDLFVEQIAKTIRSAKPWVKFGISPFGIYRNKKSDPKNGSDTNGLQNYDDLYADVLKWVNNGWVDYCVPQIYWQIGHKAADYETLIKWWDKYCGNRPLFIGEDVERTVKFPDPNNPEKHQLDAKMRLHRKLKNVNGHVLWYAKAAVDNIGNYGTLLRTTYWNKPALMPEMKFISKKAPKKVKNLKSVWTTDGYMLFWTAPKHKGWETEATKYVVYAFSKNEQINTNDAAHIVAITSNTFTRLNYRNGKNKYTFIVTPLNRIHNEGKAAKKKVKL